MGPELRVGGLERSGQVFQEAVEASRQGGPAGDENIVIAFPAIKGKDGRSRGAQPALGAIAFDRVSDLAASRHTDSQTACLCTHLRSRTYLERQRARAAADAARGAQEVGADLDAIQQKSL